MSVLFIARSRTHCKTRLHALSAFLLELGKGLEGRSCTARLPDALGSLWRRCQFCLLAEALEEVNLIIALTSMAYEKYFSLS